jgi:hypothetical protein
MKTLIALLVVLAGMSPVPAHAQNWIIFVPHERDFRVLFPEVPARYSEVDGSVAFKSSYDDFEYLVYRLPPGTPRITNAQAEIQRRLVERLGDNARAQPVPDDEDGEWQRYVFEVRRGISVHRLIEYRGRYYELQVVAIREKRAMARQTARDFFNSFHLQGIGLPAIGGILVQRFEAWCQGRTNPFARAFCEYSVCLQPGYENYPHCTALRGR